jgi:hypothetical protein
MSLRSLPVLLSSLLILLAKLRYWRLLLLRCSLPKSPDPLPLSWCSLPFLFLLGVQQLVLLATPFASPVAAISALLALFVLLGVVVVVPRAATEKGGGGWEGLDETSFLLSQLRVMGR